jgi:hypothetical protein
LQVPVASQHPAVHCAAHVFPASGGALQIMTGIVGRPGIGPHVSPRTTHSADETQSWSGPIGDVGHGPRWQLVVIWIEPQHTVPPVQSSALLQVIPGVVAPELLPLAEPPPVELPPMRLPPPLVLLPPTTTPLLDPPLPPLLLDPGSP